MKLLILTKKDATLLRELMPTPSDCNPGDTIKEWRRRELEAGSILRKIIESIEEEPAPEIRAGGKDAK